MDFVWFSILIRSQYYSNFRVRARPAPPLHGRRPSCVKVYITVASPRAPCTKSLNFYPWGPILIFVIEVQSWASFEAQIGICMKIEADPLGPLGLHLVLKGLSATTRNESLFRSTRPCVMIGLSGRSIYLVPVMNQALDSIIVRLRTCFCCSCVFV